MHAALANTPFSMGSPRRVVSVIVTSGYYWHGTVKNAVKKAHASQRRGGDSVKLAAYPDTLRQPQPPNREEPNSLGSR
ncbi:MAG TPA: hypothetical protein VIH69_01835 [Dehalococcoidia bacterium]